MFEKTTDVHRHSTLSAGVDCFHVHGTSLSKTQKSVAYAGSLSWSKIPAHIKDVQSLKQFQVKIKDNLVNLPWLQWSLSE